MQKSVLTLGLSVLNTHAKHYLRLIRRLKQSGLQRYPIQKKFHSAEFLRSIPHLRLRTPSNALLARIRSDCDLFISQFLHERDFVRLQPPIITSSDCEGAGDVFTVSSHTTAPHLSGLDEEPFFREPKFLTVSSQLHLEAFVHEHPKVWTLSPTFRAERSDTPRHVSEFWMLEVEVRTESLPDVMDIVEDMIRSLVSNLQKSKLLEQLLSIKQRGEPGDNGNFPSTSDLILERWDGLTQRRWPRITYNEAMDLLHKAVLANEFFFHHKPSWGAGLQLEHEKFIAAEVGYGSPVFVTHYPQSIKPFYMLPSKVCNTEVSGTDGRDTAACFDLLLPESCEVVGGSLREHRLHDLIQSMHKDGLKVSTERERFQGDGQPGVSSSTKAGSLEWYVDLRRYGSIPHGGFGLGFDRLLGYLAGMRNIKDVIPWPRYHGRCDC